MTPPRFWQNPKTAPGLAARLLHPLALLWRAGADRRWRRGAHARVGVPVICVGNINLGGTGKTPTVIWLMERMRDAGITAHVVTRGYGGRAQGPLRVTEGMDAVEVGDEPLLLAAFGAVWVAKDRLAGARAAVKAGASVILLDDGMQNPALVKDLTLMVVDAGAGFGNGRLFPAGPLRQSVEDGLAHADAVLTLGSPAQRKRLLDEWPQLGGAQCFGGAVLPLQTGMDWSGLRAYAFAGIGRPQKFFDTLERLGATISTARALPDHAPLSDAAMARMAREAATQNAQLVTTEKDMARMPPAWRSRVLTLPVRLFVEDADGLWQVVTAALDAADRSEPT